LHEAARLDAGGRGSRLGRPARAKLVRDAARRQGDPGARFAAPAKPRRRWSAGAADGERSRIGRPARDANAVSARPPAWPARAGGAGLVRPPEPAPPPPARERPGVRDAVDAPYRPRGEDGRSALLGRAALSAPAHSLVEEAEQRWAWASLLPGRQAPSGLASGRCGPDRRSDPAQRSTGFLPRRRRPGAR
jgi:hypothetical protein